MYAVIRYVLEDDLKLEPFAYSHKKHHAEVLRDLYQETRLEYEHFGIRKIDIKDAIVLMHAKEHEEEETVK